MRFNKFFVFLLVIGLDFAFAEDQENAGDLLPKFMEKFSSIENLLEYLLQMKNPAGKNCMNYLEELEEVKSYKPTKKDLTKEKFIEKLLTIKDRLKFLLKSINRYPPGENGRQALEKRKEYNKKLLAENKPTLKEIVLGNYESIKENPALDLEFETEEFMKNLSLIDVLSKYLLNRMISDGEQKRRNVQRNFKEGFKSNDSHLTAKKFMDMLSSIENKVEFTEQLEDPTGKEGREALEMRKKHNEYQSKHSSPTCKEIELEKK